MFPTIFRECSYGFRLGKSAHQALKFIKNFKTSTVFLIDYDIKAVFDNVNIGRLKNLFNKVVVDPRFWKCISCMIKSGIIDKNIVFYNDKRVSQGSIISPFLFNVYMHELDEFVLNYKKNIYSNAANYKSKEYGDREAKAEYKKIMHKYGPDDLYKTLKVLGSKEKVIENKRKELYEHKKKYKRATGAQSGDFEIQYVRYADDFLLGIVGLRKDAYQLRLDINTFLKSNLHLEVKKDDLVYRNKSNVMFLGHRIKLAPFHSKSRTKPVKIEALKRLKRKVIARINANEKRNALALSYRASAALLSKLKFLRSELNISLKKNQMEPLLGELLAFIDLGSNIQEKFKLDNVWEVFKKIDNKEDIKNMALNRKIIMFREEANISDKFFADILKDNLSSLFKRAKTGSNSEELKALSDDLVKKLDKLVLQCYSEQLNKRKSELVAAMFRQQKKKKGAKTFSEKELEVFGEIGESFEANRLITINKIVKTRVYAPIKIIFEKLRMKGFVRSIKDRAQVRKDWALLSDHDIISSYRNVMYGFLNYYCGADNFSSVTSLVNCVLRMSCVLTLAHKHRKNKFWVYQIYSSDIVNPIDPGNSLITRKDVLNFKQGFKVNDNCNPLNIDSLLGNS
jgi:hypothetical protein